MAGGDSVRMRSKFSGPGVYEYESLSNGGWTTYWMSVLKGRKAAKWKA